MVFYLTVDEVKAMFRVAEQALNDAKTEKQTLKALMVLILLRILYWGFRVSEVVGDKDTRIPGIQYHDINFHEGIITVKQKGKKDLDRIIDQETMNMIKLYCNMAKIRNGQLLPIHRSTAWRNIKRIALKANLARAQKIRCHNFGRHTFGVHAANRKHLFMKGGGKFIMKMISKQLGHSSTRVTEDFYLPFVTEDLKEAAFGVG